MSSLAVVAIQPVDTSELPRPEQLPMPNLNSVRSPCPACSRLCWLDEHQRHLSEVGLKVMCYFCVLKLLATGAFTPRFVRLNAQGLNL